MYRDLALAIETIIFIEKRIKQTKKESMNPVDIYAGGIQNGKLQAYNDVIEFLRKRVSRR